MNYKKSILGAILAFVVSTSCCWLPALVIAVGGGSTLLGVSQGVERSSGLFMFIGIAFLGYGAFQYYKKNKQPVAKTVILESTITCPNCGFMKKETMPTNACQFFYECSNCHEILKPKEGDCCVYCSYGTAKCPPVQLDQACC